MKYSPVLLGLWAWLAVLSVQASPTQSERDQPLRPIVAGYGEGVFTVGELLYETDFSDPENWDVQLQQSSDPSLQSRFSMARGMLDVYAAQAGCTAWLKREFDQPIAVVYRLRCPIETIDDEGIMPRDANNFWMAADPDPQGSLFDREKYTGDFGDYSDMNAYYASSGGRKNTSTRMRRYPHENHGQSLAHIALIHQDNQPEFLLKAGQWHTVQLVAFNDIIQYFFDGQLVYEIRQGERVRIEKNRQGKTEIYNPKRFPPHTRGYFGFRMVGTHHQHKDFKVYALDAK